MTAKQQQRCARDAGGPVILREETDPKQWELARKRATRTLIGSLYNAYNSIREAVPHGYRIYAMRNGSDEKDPHAMRAELYYSLTEAEEAIVHLLKHNYAFTVADIPQMDIVAVDGRNGIPAALDLSSGEIRRFHRRMRAVPVAAVGSATAKMCI